MDWEFIAVVTFVFAGFLLISRTMLKSKVRKLEKQKDDLLNLSMSLLIKTFPNRYWELRDIIERTLLSIDLEKHTTVMRGVRHLEARLYDAIAQKLLYISTLNLSKEEKSTVIKELHDEACEATRVILEGLHKTRDDILREQLQSKIPF